MHMKSLSTSASCKRSFQQMLAAVVVTPALLLSLLSLTLRIQHSVWYKKDAQNWLYAQLVD